MDQKIQRPSPQRQQQAEEHGGATAPAPAPATPQDDEQQGHQLAAVAVHGVQGGGGGGGATTTERHHRSKLTLLPLVFLIYFEVAGGPYGAEQAVSAAGPLFALLGFLAFPFVWGVPVSLVTAELAATLRGNGGFVVWADRAFGPLAGSLLGTWKYLSCVINLAAFPTLVADYLGRVAPAVAVAGKQGAHGHGARHDRLPLLPQLGRPQHCRVGRRRPGVRVAGAVRADDGDGGAEDAAAAVGGAGAGEGEERLEALLQHALLEPQLLGQREHHGRRGGAAGADVPAGARGGGGAHRRQLPAAAHGGDRRHGRAAGGVGERLLGRRSSFFYQ
uniref:Uncharacterized protein n=1 Tax=Oryza meridionalis TaxID=40149 RepID=A0A0E0D1E2_9ORYZ